MMFTTVLLRDLRVGWRQWIADPGYTAVIVLGLAAAIACCTLVAQLAWNELRPDPRIADPDRVVQLEFRGNIPGRHDDWFPQAPIAFCPSLRQSGTAVGTVACVAIDEVAVRAGDRLASLVVAFADPGLANLFALRAQRGDLAAALARPDAIALTPRAARRLFGDADALGRQVTVRGQALTVVALLVEPDAASGLRSDALGSLASPASGLTAAARAAWFVMNGAVFARLAPGHSAAELGAAAQALFDDGPGARSVPPEWTANGRQAAFLRAVSLSRRAWYGAGSDGVRALVMGLVASGLLLLGLAVANYVNLTTVRTLRRQREIAVRKSLGASPARLGAQFVAESTVLAGVSAVAGLAIAWLVGPALVDLLELTTARGVFDLTPTIGVATVVLVLLLGAAAGVYPARIALGVRCAVSLAGRDPGETSTGRQLRRASTALQCAVALALCSAGGAVAWQNHHVATLERGYRTAGLVAVDVPDDTPAAQAAAFRTAVAHAAGVQATAWSDDVPGRQVGSVSSIANARAHAMVRMTVVEPGFFDVYAVPVFAGAPRYDAPPEAERRAIWATLPADASEAVKWAALMPHDLPIVVDVTTARVLGFDDPSLAVGSLIHGGGDFMQAGTQSWRIVAVVAPLRLDGARVAPLPQVFMLSGGVSSTLTLRGSDPTLLRQAVESAWPRFFPNDIDDVDTVDAQLAATTASDRRVATFALGATLLALSLGGFGVYALAAYTVRRNAREIVVRKLYGAGRARIALLLVREFAPLLAVAALLGLPLGGWLVQAWLAGFVERTNAAFWALPVAFFVLVSVTALAAVRHAIVAMNMRPVVALKD